MAFPFEFGSSLQAISSNHIRQLPDTEALWTETRGVVRENEGVLILDDYTLDKPYARRIELVPRHRSGKHHKVVSGINLISRVMGLRSLAVYGLPLGLLGSGFLAEILGAPLALVVNGLVGIVFGIAIAVATRGVWRYSWRT